MGKPESRPSPFRASDPGPNHDSGIVVGVKLESAEAQTVEISETVMERAILVIEAGGWRKLQQQAALDAAA